MIRNLLSLSLSAALLSFSWLCCEAALSFRPAVIPAPAAKCPCGCGCPAGGVVLDPFAGSGTVGVVAKRLGRSFVGCELNPEYARIARQRIAAATPEAA